jgi:hypothetical protein
MKPPKTARFPSEQGPKTATGTWVDSTRGDSLSTWDKQGKPAVPSSAQLAVSETIQYPLLLLLGSGAVSSSEVPRQL